MQKHIFCPYTTN
ncbi:hypothetical protein GN958_ATG01647 [Phytophthora infestans]|uniref:Uncharacterized protein n=1 Tax=Phytophthora infestans TaxID=4787 RepID=A0A8S9V6H3_PHYIN|nr:hypothetical protein GN958_ATG01647 [Phytophthora infestans]